MIELTQERLKQLVRYHPDTGRFINLYVSGQRAKRARPGRDAGCANDVGHIVIKLDKKSYSAGRLAWFYMTGEWPPRDKLVCPKDGDRTNLAWGNLVLLSQGEATFFGRLRKGLPTGKRIRPRRQKLGLDDIRLIIRSRGTTPASLLAYRFGVTPGHIRNVWRMPR